MNVPQDGVAPTNEPEDDESESEHAGVFDGLTALDVVDGELVPRRRHRRSER